MSPPPPHPPARLMNPVAYFQLSHFVTWHASWGCGTLADVSMCNGRLKKGNGIRSAVGLWWAEELDLQLNIVKGYGQTHIIKRSQWWLGFRLGGGYEIEPDVQSRLSLINFQLLQIRSSHWYHNSIWATIRIVAAWLIWNSNVLEGGVSSRGPILYHSPLWVITSGPTRHKSFKLLVLPALRSRRGDNNSYTRTFFNLPIYQIEGSGWDRLQPV